MTAPKGHGNSGDYSLWCDKPMLRGDRQAVRWPVQLKFQCPDRVIHNLEMCGFGHVTYYVRRINVTYT